MGYLATIGSSPTAPLPHATPRDSSTQQVDPDWLARERRCVFAQQSNPQLLPQLKATMRIQQLRFERTEG